MIPVKLSVRNFMPYRDNVPELYFAGVHTACISGDNGNGKSALIDAITWALWGKARAGSDDELIHQGEHEMEVEFEFAVGHHKYRVIRKRAKPKGRKRTGQTILELQMVDNGSVRAISGDSVRQTQQKVIDILHMDYETFINSAYLRQGRADEFTIATPSRRKQVLADILGLTIYDDLEEMAKTLAKEQETAKTQLEATIGNINEDLTKLPLLRVELEQASGELSVVDKIVKEQEYVLKELRQKQELLKTKQLQLVQFEEHIAAAGKRLELREQEIEEHHARIEAYEELIAQRDVIEKGYSRFLDAKKLKDEMEQKARQWAVLSQKKHKLEMDFERAQQALLRNHALTDSKITELEARVGKLTHLKEQMHQVETRLSQFDIEEEALRQKRQSLQKLQAQISYLESANAQLARDIAELEEKLKLLRNQQEARCPLCETDLGADGIKLVESKYIADRNAKLEESNINRDDFTQKRVQLKSLETEIAHEEKRLVQTRNSGNNEIGMLKKSFQEAEESAEKLKEERARLSEIEQQLAGKEFASAEWQGLMEVEAALSILAYDSQEHESLRGNFTELQKFEAPKRELEEADRLISQEKVALSRAEDDTRELKKGLESDREKKQALDAELEALPQLNAEVESVEGKYSELVKQQKQAQERVWNLKAEVKRCGELETKKKGEERRLNQVLKEEQIYKELMQAFGKKGIQAMLIETALPEIETEANKLLARMTDNRMHIKIEPQRDTKTGSTVETLDINIADELGIRNYDMFSGGEAFRINFAIRIALSKLLARRSGAPLPTLIIDEGFGTQDAAGIGKLIEAIESIQADFQKILVITHMEELKNAFPTRIEVIKTPAGSTLQLS